MNKRFVFLLLFCICGSVFNSGQAQILKKLKDKIEDKAVKKIIGEDDNKTGGNNSNNNVGNSQSSSNSGRPSNKGGGGLTNSTPPDVLKQITEAEKAHTEAKYSDSRYFIQQALVGVEIQLGRELLISLPADILGLKKDSTQDRVMSTQWGWNNLSIQRVYNDKKDKELNITIGNNILYSGMLSLYFGGMYTRADSKDQNIKQVRVQGNKAVIEYDDDKGYTLIMPLGQSSMIVWNCINFKDENEVMKAAESFNIDDIKKRMGEQ